MASGDASTARKRLNDRAEEQCASREVELVMLRFRDWSTAALSCSVAALLWVLLRRCFAQYGVELDALLLRPARDFRAPEWILLALTAAGAGVAFWKNDARSLVRLQGASLAAGLFLILFDLGSVPGKKVDLRLALALVDGSASLLCSYVCALTLVALALRRRASGRSEQVP